MGRKLLGESPVRITTYGAIALACSCRGNIVIFDGFAHVRSIFHTSVFDANGSLQNVVGRVNGVGGLNRANISTPLQIVGDFGMPPLPTIELTNERTAFAGYGEDI